MKITKLVLVLVLAMLITMTGCFKKSGDDTPVNIIQLNATDVDMSGYGLTDINHQFKRVTLKEANRLFAEKGSAILYYGYVGCPWCSQVVPVLNETAKQTGQTIYYVDMKNKDGNTEEDYNSLISYVEATLAVEKDEPVFYVPHVFAVKNGEVVGDHVSAVESYTPEQGNMSKSQKEELKKIYLEIFKLLP